MNLSKALKVKNVIQTELVSLYEFIYQNGFYIETVQTVQTESEDVFSYVSNSDGENVLDKFNKIKEMEDKLVELKSKISVANVNMYELFFKLETNKKRLSNLNGLLNKCRNNAPIIHHSGNVIQVNKSFLNKEDIQNEIENLKVENEELQDKIDEYNAKTLIDFQM